MVTVADLYRLRAEDAVLYQLELDEYRLPLFPEPSPRRVIVDTNRHFLVKCLTAATRIGRTGRITEVRALDVNPSDVLCV